MLWHLAVFFGSCGAEPRDSSTYAEVMPFSDWREMFEKEHLTLFGALDSAVELSSATHWEERSAIYDENVKHISDHNAKHDAGETTYRLGVNQFAAMTQSEYKSAMLNCMKKRDGSKKQTTERHVERRRPNQVDSIDWRAKGAVSKVKNQGVCGSCWAFSTTGAIEGAVAIETGKMVSLSEQQLMDCSTAEGDHSCEGGLMDFAFEYVEKNGGVDSEEDYPYLMKDEACNKEKEETKHVSAIKSHVDVESNNEKALAKALMNGPVAVAIEADQRNFQLYKSGVMTGSCGVALDHGVLVVGMGIDAGQAYWIVKNSWGAWWGEDGYVRLAKDSPEDQPHGKCGITLQASYPIAAKPPPTMAPVPTPKPSPSNQPDLYEDPNVAGCKPSELDGRILGVDGSICMPKCKRHWVFFKTCPEAPSDFQANAQCMIQEQDGTQLCGLSCDPSDESSCNPSLNCHCRAVSGMGICTYDDPNASPAPATASIMN